MPKLYCLVSQKMLFFGGARCKTTSGYLCVFMRHPTIQKFQHSQQKSNTYFFFLFEKKQKQEKTMVKNSISKVSLEYKKGNKELNQNQ